MQNEPKFRSFYTSFRIVTALCLISALIACGESDKAQLATKGNRNQKNVKVDPAVGVAAPGLSAVSFLALRQTHRVLDLALNLQDSTFLSKDCERMLENSTDNLTEITIIHNGQKSQPGSQPCVDVDGTETILVYYELDKNKTRQISRIEKKPTPTNRNSVTFRLPSKSNDITARLSEDLLLVPKELGSKLFSFYYNNGSQGDVGLTLERKRLLKRTDGKRSGQQNSNKKAEEEQNTPENKLAEERRKRLKEQLEGNSQKTADTNGQRRGRRGKGQNYDSYFFIQSSGEINTSTKNKWTIKIDELNLNIKYIRQSDGTVITNLIQTLESSPPGGAHDLTICLLPAGDFFTMQKIEIRGKSIVQTSELNINVAANNLITLKQDRTTFRLPNECLNYGYNSLQSILIESEKYLKGSAIMSDFNPPRKIKKSNASSESARHENDKNKSILRSEALSRSIDKKAQDK